MAMADSAVFDNSAITTDENNSETILPGALRVRKYTHGPVRLAYLDCFSGISGDMALGALVHAGADLDRIAEQLDGLSIEDFRIERELVEDHGIVATRVHVKTRPNALIRTYSNVRGLLEGSDLSLTARQIAGRVFLRLAEGLGRVYGKEPGLVTFRELGETEVLVEVIGVAVALDILGVERVFASPIPTGLGMAHHEYGLTPIPSPEVVELLQAVPTYTRGTPVELVTPVGAAIASAVVEGFGDMPLMRAEQVGYGAGHPRPDFPNLLRVVIGEEEPARLRTEPSAPADASRWSALGEHPSAAARLAAVPAPQPEAGARTEVLVEALVDDPGDDGRVDVLERLFEAGAAEAWATPVVMRGGRAGLRLCALCGDGAQDAVGRAISSLPGAGALYVSGAGRSEPNA
jgi:uncharacterized protein (TIGR00299 family) protein